MVVNIFQVREDYFTCGATKALTLTLTGTEERESEWERTRECLPVHRWCPGYSATCESFSFFAGHIPPLHRWWWERARQTGQQRRDQQDISQASHALIIQLFIVVLPHQLFKNKMKHSKNMKKSIIYNDLKQLYFPMHIALLCAA